MPPLPPARYADRARPASPSHGRGRPCVHRWGVRRSSDQHRDCAEGDRVGRAGLDDLVALTGRRQSTDHHGHAAHRDHPADVRLEAIDQRTCVNVGGGAPRRLPGDQHRRTARPGPERRAVARGVSETCRRLAHCRAPQLMFTRAPRTVSVALALISSVPVASIVMVAALILSEPFACSVMAPLLFSILSWLPCLSLRTISSSVKRTTPPFSCASSTTPCEPSSNSR